MGRLAQAIDTYCQPHKLYNVDYVRCKNLLTQIQTLDPTSQQCNKKFDLLWCILRSEGDKHANKVDVIHTQFLNQLNSSSNVAAVWDNQFQADLQSAAEYMVLNAYIVAKLLLSIQSYCNTLTDKDIRDKRFGQLASFLHDQWFEGRTAHRQCAKKLHEIHNRDSTTLCAHCDRPCFFTIKHNNSNCNHTYCIIDLVNNCIRPMHTHTVQLQCPVCKCTDTLNIAELQITAVSNSRLIASPLSIQSRFSETTHMVHSPVNSTTSSNISSRNVSYDTAGTSNIDTTTNKRTTYDDDSIAVKQESDTMEDSADKIRKRGFSCHQCKTSKPNSQLFVCKSHLLQPQARRSCHKKYCITCLQWCYHMKDVTTMTEESEQRQNWQCPSCYDLCTCAACKRKKMKALTGIHPQRPAKRQLTTPSTHMLPSQHHKIFDTAQQSVLKAALLQQTQFNNTYFTNNTVHFNNSTSSQPVVTKQEATQSSNNNWSGNKTQLQQQQQQPQKSNAYHDNTVSTTALATSSTVQPVNPDNIIMSSEMINKLTVLAEQLLRAQKAGVNVKELLNQQIPVDTYQPTTTQQDVLHNWQQSNNSNITQDTITNTSTTSLYPYSNKGNATAPMPTMHDLFQLDYCAIDYSQLPLEQQPISYRNKTANQPTAKTNYQQPQYDNPIVLDNIQQLIEQYQATTHEPVQITELPYPCTPNFNTEPYAQTPYNHNAYNENQSTEYTPVIDATQQWQNAYSTQPNPHYDIYSMPQ